MNLKTLFKKIVDNDEKAQALKQEINNSSRKTIKATKETTQAFKEFNETLKKCRAHLIALAIGVKIDDH